jgi:hypothetical protein
VLCDDFEGTSFDPQKWMQSPNDMLQSVTGPQGSPTNVADVTQKLGTHVDNLGIDAAGSEITVSFWFKATKMLARQGVMSAALMSFNSRGNLPIFLDAQTNGLVWRTQSGYFAPSKPAATIEQNAWYCVALYLTSVHMDIRFLKAGAPNQVQTYVIDDMPTPSIDEMWSNLPATERGISGQPSFGSEPTFPSEIYIDDVRIARDKSNVCGIQQ